MYMLCCVVGLQVFLLSFRVECHLACPMTDSNTSQPSNTLSSTPTFRSLSQSNLKAFCMPSTHGRNSGAEPWGSLQKTIGNGSVSRTMSLTLRILHGGLLRLQLDGKLLHPAICKESRPSERGSCINLCGCLCWRDDVFVTSLYYPM